MSNININQIVLDTRDAFSQANDTLKQASKQALSTKAKLYEAIFTDFEYEMKANKIDNKGRYNFVLGYFEVLESALLIEENEIALQNIVNNAQKVLAKNLFTFEFGFFPVMVQIIDNLKHFKSISKVKSINATGAKSYQKALAKVLKKALKRKNTAILLNAPEISKSLNKLSYLQLLQISKSAKILANHKIAIHTK